MKRKAKSTILIALLIVIGVILVLLNYNLLDYFGLRNNKVIVNNKSYSPECRIKWVGSLLNKNYGSEIPFDTVLIYSSSGEEMSIPDSYGESRFIVELKDTILIKPIKFKKVPWIKSNFLFVISGQSKRNLNLNVKVSS